jgi:hypothetical protein
MDFSAEAVIMENNLKVPMRTQKLLFLFIVACPCLFFAGCASLREAGKKIWGSSIAHLEASRSTGRSETIALRAEVVFKKAEEILKKAGAEVYLKDPEKHYMAAMDFDGHVDTTQVGIFLTPQGDGATLVEVASMSPNLTEQVAGFLFEELKKGEKE